MRRRVIIMRMRVGAVLVVGVVLLVEINGRGIDVGACCISHHRGGLMGVRVGAVFVVVG